MGGLGGIFTFQRATNATWQFLFVSGAGMMLFIRNIVSAAGEHRSDPLGKEKPKADLTFKDILN
jgi:hypothetical protein